MAAAPRPAGPPAPASPAKQVAPAVPTATAGGSAAAVPGAPPPASSSKDGSPQPNKNIQVFLRIRPRVPKELTESHSCTNLTMDPVDPKVVHITRTDELVSGTAAATAPRRTYNFHQVFGPDSTQDDVYNRVAADAVNSAFEGYDGVIFVYGQTGSGKTFTIGNTEPNKLGILPRAVNEVWSRIAADRGQANYTCQVSYVQLYSEVLMNLLEDKPFEHRVKLSGTTTRQANITMLDERTGNPIERLVNNERETMQLFDLGSTRKEMASTEMNATSSRSHTVFTMTITRSVVAAGAAPTSGGVVPMATEGKLILIDLAGSERIKKTDVTGKQLEEAKDINSSLLTLGRVVHALTEKKKAQHVPFRESKLTRLLQYSLLGYGRTTIVINVSPSDYNTGETISAVQFGQRAMTIEQSAQKHETFDYKAMYLELQGQFDKAVENAVTGAIADQKRMTDADIEAYKSRIGFLEEANQLYIKEVDSLRAQLNDARGGKGTPQVAPAASPQSKTPAAIAAGGVASPVSTSGGGPPAPAASSSSVTSEDFLLFANRLRLRTAETEEKLVTMRDELAQVHRNAEAKEVQLLAVSKRYQIFRLNAVDEIGKLRAHVTELQAELSACKGTDFLTTGAMQMDLPAALPDTATASVDAPGGRGAGTASPSSESSNRLIAGAASADGAYDGELQRALQDANDMIAELTEERQLFIVYQDMAKKAIRFLHGEREAAVLHLKRLLEGSSPTST